MPFEFREPLVSIVIVNWNYGRYVSDAIQSVKDQSYRNLECLVVDNGSTDASADVIAASITGDARFRLHRLPHNHGHLGAAIQSLGMVIGDFINFLDADDVLLPEFIKTHIMVHLNASLAAGCTSSNCLDMAEDGSALTAGNYLARLSWRKGEPSLAPKTRNIEVQKADDREYEALADMTRYASSSTRGWLWSPGSSNVFRRRLLMRLAPPTRPPEIFGGVDGFFLPIVHAITGTHFIDRPLSAYRHHAANDHSVLPSLVGVRSGTPEAEKRGAATLRLALATLIDGFDSMPIYAARLWEVLAVVASTDEPSRPFGHPDVKAAFQRQYSSLARKFGERVVLDKLRNWLALRECVEIASAARKDRSRLRTIRKVLSVEFQRTRRRWRGGKK